VRPHRREVCRLRCPPDAAGRVHGGERGLQRRLRLRRLTLPLPLLALPLLVRLRAQPAAAAAAAARRSNCARSERSPPDVDQAAERFSSTHSTVRKKELTGMISYRCGEIASVPFCRSCLRQRRRRSIAHGLAPRSVTRGSRQRTGDSRCKGGRRLHRLLHRGRLCSRLPAAGDTAVGACSIGTRRAPRRARQRRC
jgi:hypothetical protein